MKLSTGGFQFSRGQVDQRHHLESVDRSKETRDLCSVGLGVVERLHSPVALVSNDEGNFSDSCTKMSKK